MPSIDEIKNRKFCKFHQIVGHSTNNYVRFRDLIHKAIKDRRLKFEEKSNLIKVDTKPFDIDSNYVEPVTLLIGMVGLDDREFDERKLQDDMTLDLFKNTERPIYPKLRDDSLDAFLKQRDGNANVAMCPRCNVVFDINAVIAYEK